MEYLEQHGLSTDEINYLCLYAIGLRGKEVGEYIQIKRHYIISHEIRKKLGIDEHETNIGLYIRRQMKNSRNKIRSVSLKFVVTSSLSQGRRFYMLGAIVILNSCKSKYTFRDSP